MSSNGVPKVEVIPGTETRESFDGVTALATAETASTAIAAQATAAIQARYIMALKRPRDWDDVRVKLLASCKRPRFAETARYLKPVGKGVEGWSVRFAEECVRNMTNVLPETATIFDDSRKRILRQTVTDLEANVTYSLDLTIEKTVERSRLKDGQIPLSVRTNSNGAKTFIVEATEDELLNKQAALVSKALRQNALRLMPSDILEECLDAVYATQRTEDAKDPDAARKRLVDAFMSIGVKPSDLKLYLGHEIASSAPSEIAELRAVFAAIRDGEGSWKEALELKQKGQSADVKPATAKDKVAAAREKANGKANGAANGAPQPGTYDPAESGPRATEDTDRGDDPNAY